MFCLDFVWCFLFGVAAVRRRRHAGFLLLHSPVLSGPSDAGEIRVATLDGCEFGICRFLVVGVVAFLFGTLHADAVGVEAGHRSDFELAAASVAAVLCEEPVGHFFVLLGSVAVFRLAGRPRRSLIN